MYRTQEDHRSHSLYACPQPFRYKRILHYTYDMQDVLGSGSFSTVYRGINEQTKQPIAVKVVKLNSLTFKKLEELHEQEITIIRELDHPHVLRCMDVLTSTNHCYFVTQLCEGGSLEALLKQKRCLSEEELYPLCSQIYAGLRYLFEHNIVHRDLKTANIFLKDGKIKIADFGFAIHAKQTFQDDCHIGSDFYMSPQGLIDKVYGPKTDVWAFGVILYELTHGKLPFSSPVLAQLIQEVKINISQRSFKFDLSSSLKQLIKSCLQVNFQQRISVIQIEKSDFMKNGVPKRQVFRQFVNGAQKTVRVKLDAGRRVNTEYSKEINFKKITENIEDSNHKANLNLNKFTSTKVAPLAQRSHNINDRFFGNQNAPSFQQQANKNRSFHVLTVQSPDHFGSQNQNSFRALKKSQKNLKTSIITGQVSFNDAVGLMHYCRVAYKFLKIDDCLIFKAEVKFLLVSILNELLKRLQDNKIVYGDKQTKIKKQKKLKSVIAQYLAKYNPGNTQPFQVNLCSLHQKLSQHLANMQIKMNADYKKCYIAMLFVSLTVQLIEANNEANYKFFGKEGVVIDALSQKSVPTSLQAYIECKKTYATKQMP